MPPSDLIISTNDRPPPHIFEDLLRNTVSHLEEEYQREPRRFEGASSDSFEEAVFDSMTTKAVGTPFEGTIRFYGGHSFPDIVAKKLYGVEVKTTQSRKWKTTGNSVLESSRIDGVERIYLMFGIMTAPCAFRYRKYEECLCDVAVTHSPRYLIDMDLSEGESIFDKVGITYDQLRSMKNPIMPIIDYFRKTKTGIEEFWWLNPQGEEKTVDFAMRGWSSLTSSEKHEMIALAMAKFPEIFGPHSQDKYERLGAFLIREKGLVCSSLRDNFSAGGKVNLELDGVTYQRVPKVFEKLIEHLPLLFSFFDKALFDSWLIKFSDYANSFLQREETELTAEILVRHLRRKFETKGA